jgi:formate/nitrite transporter FocA (FNT family)
LSSSAGYILLRGILCNILMGLAFFSVCGLDKLGVHTHRTV